ncbi:MAG: hypothetical protein ACE5JH_08160 [Acidobacteriota bacterium]
MIPSWPPSAAISRISRARILSLIRCFFSIFLLSMSLPSLPSRRGL